MLDYVNELAKQRFKNIAEINDNLAKSKIPNDLNTKILNYAKRHGLEYEYVLHKARMDSEFASVFAKDPSKQTMHQNLAADYLVSRLPNFRVLPPSGDDAFYLMAGALHKGSAITSTAKPKSIDFEWGNSLVTCYASHKYTHQEGGSQDNQLKEIRDFLGNARQYAGNKFLFVAICDGDYYQEKPTAKDGVPSNHNYKTRIEYLQKQYANTGQVLVCTVNEISDLFEEYVKSRMPVVNTANVKP